MTATAWKALRLAIIYVVFGGLWILFSDRALEALIDDPAQLTRWQTWKGWFYVLITAVLVFGLVWRQLCREDELIDHLRASRARLMSVFEGSRDAILLVLGTEQLRLANRPGRQLLGLADAQFPSAVPAWLRERMRALAAGLAAEGRWTGEIWVPTADGLERPFLVTVSRVDEVAGLGGQGASVWVLTDMSELRRTQKQLEDLAWFDPLTRLPNRRLIRRHLAQAIERRPDGASMALLYIDLDNFKDINDSLGHPAGDEVLVSVSERLQGCLAPGHRLAHAGGDEFIVLIESLSDPALATDLAGRLLERLGQPLTLADGHRVFTGASIGVSLYPDHTNNVTGLIQYADAAMHAAKKLGRNRWQLFEAPMIEGASQRIRLDARLRDALERDELELHFQPIVEVGGDGRIVGFEALLRWSPPGLGTVSPAEFIPVAEATGLIVPIGEWVLKQACRFAAALPPVAGQSCAVAVNLAPTQLTSAGLLGQVSRALAESGLAPECLVLEITESTLMEQGPRGGELIARLRALGVRVSLDDFGTGYSSLAYLKHFDVDALKIDRSFINELDRGTADRELVTAIVALARCFKLKVIAEGVEDQAQLEVLAGLGCDCYQGWLFSPAVPADQARRLWSGSE